jgi:NitT/TauT family transport system permease protein
MRRISYWPSVAGFAIFVAAWWGIAVGLKINPIILPTPRAVLGAFAQNWSRLVIETAITMAEAVLGFVLGGVAAYLVAVAFIRWHVVHEAMYPYAIALKSTPLIALAPLLTMWLGDGVAAKVVMAAIVAYFPVLVGAVQGLANVDQELSDLMRSYSASWWQVLVKVRVPRSMNPVFAALKTASSLAVVGAVIGEFTGSTRGVGHLINIASAYFETPLMFAAVITLSLAGVAFFGLVSLAQRKVLDWEVQL